jgi:hypothetical protein
VLFEERRTNKLCGLLRVAFRDIDIYRGLANVESLRQSRIRVEPPFDVEPKPKASEREAVMVMNISGTVQTSRIPSQLTKYSTFVIDVDGAEPSSDVINSPETLAAFENICRQLFAAIEARHPYIRRVHLLGVLPVSAAVVLGRVHNREVHPSLATYHLSDTRYSIALELT